MNIKIKLYYDMQAHHFVLPVWDGTSPGRSLVTGHKSFERCIYSDDILNPPWLSWSTVFKASTEQIAKYELKLTNIKLLSLLRHRRTSINSLAEIQNA